MAIKDHDGYPPLSPFAIVEPMSLVKSHQGDQPHPHWDMLRLWPPNAINKLNSIFNLNKTFSLGPKSSIDLGMGKGQRLMMEKRLWFNWDRGRKDMRDEWHRKEIVFLFLFFIFFTDMYLTWIFNWFALLWLVQVCKKMSHHYCVTCIGNNTNGSWLKDWQCSFWNMRD